MTWMFVVFLLGAMTGLGCGLSWGDALLKAEKDGNKKHEDELIAEIVRQRILISNIIGGSEI